jgi:hypothetical protein
MAVASFQTYDFPGMLMCIPTQVSTMFSKALTA